METRPEIRDALMEAIAQTDVVFFLTDPDGRIIYANPAFERLTGYTRQEAVGKNANILKSGHHPKAFYEEMWATLKSGGTWSARIVNRRKDGSTYIEDQHICPIKDPFGEIKYFLSTRRDVTHEIQLETQLAHSQKMESLGLLAGQISHDFNNLLTVIIGSMELVMEDLPEGSVGKKLGSEILRSSKESAALIKNLMTFARRHDTRPVVATLNAPVEEMKALLGSLMGKAVSVEYSLAPDLAEAKIEKEHLKQAIMNIAVNAKDAMEGKGRLTIKTYNAAPGSLPRSLPGGKYSVLEMSDTGPGIPKDILPRIFEPFFTTKPKGKGTGLGLSSVYGIVMQNNGHIFASNKNGGGAVFTFYFPAF